VQELLKCPGIDVNLTDNRGRNALDYISKESLYAIQIAQLIQGHAASSSHTTDAVAATVGQVTKKRGRPKTKVTEHTSNSIVDTTNGVGVGTHVETAVGSIEPTDDDAATNNANANAIATAYALEETMPSRKKLADFVRHGSSPLRDMTDRTRDLVMHQQLAIERQIQQENLRRTQQAEKDRHLERKRIRLDEKKVRKRSKYDVLIRHTDGIEQGSIFQINGSETLRTVCRKYFKRQAIKHNERDLYELWLINNSGGDLKVDLNQTPETLAADIKSTIRLVLKKP
jgi:hypothetical protein